MRLPFVLVLMLLPVGPAGAAEPGPDLGAIFRLVRLDGDLVVRYRDDADWTDLERLAKSEPDRYRVVPGRKFAAVGDGIRASVDISEDRTDLRLLWVVAHEGRDVVCQFMDGRFFALYPANDSKRAPRLWRFSNESGYRLKCRDGVELTGSIEELLWTSSADLEQSILPVLARVGLVLVPTRDDPLVARLVLDPPKDDAEGLRRVEAWIESIGSERFDRRQAGEETLRKARLSSRDLRQLVRAERSATNLEQRRRLGRILDRRGRLAAAWRLVEANGLADSAEFLEELTTKSPVKAIRDAARARQADR